MPVDACDSHVEWYEDCECPLQGDVHEPWDEDKDLAGQGNVGNQQDNACNDVPAASEEHVVCSSGSGCFLCSGCRAVE